MFCVNVICIYEDEVVKEKKINKGLLFEEVSEGKEEKEGNDVTVDREDKLADAHVEGSS